MKKLGIVLGSILAASISFTAGSVMAAGSSASNKNPCKVIRKACEAAGYTRNPKVDLDTLYTGCLKPLLMDGKEVAGVNVTPEEIQACKQKMSSSIHPQHQSAKQQTPAPQSAQ